MPDTGQRGAGTEDDPGALCAHAASCWDRAFRGYDLTAAQKEAFAREGLIAISRALALDPTQPQALAYKVLLLRVRAVLERDPATRDALEAEADTLRDTAVDAEKLGLIRRA